MSNLFDYVQNVIFPTVHLQWGQTGWIYNNNSSWTITLPISFTSWGTYSASAQIASIEKGNSVPCSIDYVYNTRFTVKKAAQFGDNSGNVVTWSAIGY